MKNYNEVAESVFRRSEEIIEQNNKRRRTLIKIGAAAGCLLIAGAFGFGVWRNSVSGADMVLSAGQFANDGKDHSGESDTVVAASSTERSGNSTADINSSSFGDLHMNSGNSGAADSNAGNLPYPNFPEHFIKRIDGYKYEYGENLPPENGQFIYSTPLQNSMEEYGYKDEEGYDIIYNVTVEFFSNGKLVDVSIPEIREGEWDRMIDLGYQCGFATSSENWGEIVTHEFHVNFTKEQLENFVPDEKYGYILSLHGEHVKGMEDFEGGDFVFHGFANLDTD